MATTPRDALHDVHTAINDVLTGYTTMLDRAEPEIVPVITDLVILHRKHASALKDRLAQLGDDGSEDTSFRGALNSLVITLRDWVTGLDEGSMDAVTRGEKALRDIYDDALAGWPSGDDPQTAHLLINQYQEIDRAVSKLKKR